MIDEVLYVALANHIEASMQAQGAHWNVVGPNFKEYHAFFSDIYEDWYSQVDRLAEYIRITTDKSVSSSLNSFAAKKTINGLSNNVYANDLVNDLLVTNSKLRADILKIKEAALDFPGLQNYCDERIDSHDKLNWMLKASIK